MSSTSETTKTETAKTGTVTASKPHAAAPGEKGGKSSEAAESASKVKAKAAQKVQSVLAALGRVRGEFLFVFKGVLSPDAPTRRMSVFFWFSLLGVIAVGGVAWKRHSDKTRELRLLRQQELIRRIEEETQKDAEAMRLKKSIVNLGTFQLELKDIPDSPRAQGVLNMAVLELVLFCDNQETAEYIEIHRVFARNEISTILTPLDRDDLLTSEGKKRFKAIVIRQLNEWLPEGEVQDLYISKLIVN